jgi:hypothetical protein
MKNEKFAKFKNNLFFKTRSEKCVSISESRIKQNRGGEKWDSPCRSDLGGAQERGYELRNL